jgi:cyclopropane-fatty-acyl-phospholipid synthase
MGRSTAQRAIEYLLALADVRIDAGHPWDIKVHDPDFFPRLLARGSRALGESYMDGWWDCEALDQCISRMLSADMDKKAKKRGEVLVAAILSRLFNAQRKSRAFIIGERHYDLGNDLYRAMLDRRMVYSCGYWATADTLEDAQEAKLDLICRKIGLERGMRVLDIGCGWGSFARYAAERYGAEVVGITVSVEQEKYAASLCRDLPVDIRLQDYRDVDEQFDHIVSVGMVEHVGYRNYRTYMNVV